MDAASDRTSEDRQLALLVHSAVDYAIFMLDTEGRVRTWNAGAQRIKGYSRDEIIGRHMSVFHTEEEVARGHPAQVLRLALHDGRYEEEGWCVRKDGSRFWAGIVITPVYDDDGELQGFAEVSNDLTVRRLREEQMRTKALELELANGELAEFRQLVSSVRDYAIFMMDPAGVIRSWNTGAQRLKGYEPEEVIGRHFSLFYTDDDRARDHPAHELAVAIREGSYEEEGWRVRKDGSMFWASVTITAVHDEAGRLTGFAKVTRDLTARKASEDALQAAVDQLRETNDELDRFAAVAAHDLTDPLRTISGFAELLERAELPATAAEHVRHIRTSSVRLTRMLQGLLTYARAGKALGPREPVDLAQATQQVLADLAGPVAERGARVTVSLPEGATVLANAGDVGLVLQNLVSNALKFGDRERPAVTIAAEATGRDCWRVTVQDNGDGIAAADRQRIFGAFERAHAGARRAGYGLGLAICERLVDRYGGTIGVDSEPPDGSRFWFTLPAG